ncbi:RNA recognition domain-containing protein [Aphelenchoides avenae]|nr:RNA recognition domain-containing protein [Aphelenchus avenae]
MHLKNSEAPSEQTGKPSETRSEKRKKRVERLTERKSTESRTVFVGNAPTTATRKSIKKLFSEFGKIEAVYARSLLEKSEKLTKKMEGTDKAIKDNLQSTHFYVRFSDEEDAKRATQRHGEILDGHKLRVTLSTKREFNSRQTIFVGNVPFSATEDELAEHFSSCGAVDSVRITRDKRTGQGKGFAYVAFSESSIVPLALNMNGSQFLGRELRVSKVHKKKQRLVAGAQKNKILRGERRKERKQAEAKKLTDKISKFSTIGDRDQQRKERPAKKHLSKGVVKAIKKRKGKKHPKSLMT